MSGFSAVDKCRFYVFFLKHDIVVTSDVDCRRASNYLILLTFNHKLPSFVQASQIIIWVIQPEVTVRKYGYNNCKKSQRIHTLRPFDQILYYFKDFPSFRLLLICVRCIDFITVAIPDYNALLNQFQLSFSFITVTTDKTTCILNKKSTIYMR